MPTLTTLVDSTIPVAADFNNNFTALNQAIGTSTVITSYAPGDVLYASATNKLSALPAGTNGHVLTLASGIPSWAASGGLRAILTPQAATFPTANFPQLIKNSGTNWTDYTLDADAGTDEAAFWHIALPTGITVNSASADVYFRCASATSGDVIFQITTITRAEGEAWDTAGTTDSFTAETVPGTAGMVGMVTKALTITSWAAGETLAIKLNRDADAAGDTLVGDVKIMFVVIRIS